MRAPASNLHSGVLEDGEALVRFNGGLRGRVGELRKAIVTVLEERGVRGAGRLERVRNEKVAGWTHVVGL
jgi:hypothetical protein